MNKIYNYLAILPEGRAYQLCNTYDEARAYLSATEKETGKKGQIIQRCIWAANKRFKNTEWTVYGPFLDE